MGDNRALAQPAQVSEYLGVPVDTLTQWRYRRTGPQFLKVGRHVRYRWGDVETWLTGQAQLTNAA